MSITLYSATVPAWLQVLHSISGLLDKAEAFCAETGLAPDELIQARLADDMLPFAYQIRATTTHSLGALEALRAGVIHPDRSAPPATMVALRELVGRTIVALEAVDAEDLNSYVGKDMRFDAGALVLDFVAEDFLLSFAQPNLYFHAVTAYDILRSKGMQIGKRDYLGRPRVKA
ncbi:DUF1993 domain-containing protein [Novosphingobium sp.]|uniref:DUF1993 domain-containing protein n=1 Tax=Novosphingobium sp. TaxID=1874826 RepID=UPI003B51B356